MTTETITTSSKPYTPDHAATGPIGVAVIGAGGIGWEHLRQYGQHPGAKIVALAETDIERGREAAAKFNVPVCVTDYRELLGRSDIDVFSIALPNFLHGPVSLDALRAGKHVMLEKPMATSAEEAQTLADEAKKRSLLLMVGQNRRFEPEAQTARRLIDDGVLGDVYYARTSWFRRSGIPRIGSWFTQKKYAGGGCCYDIGVHALDRCLYIMNEYDAVTVSGQTFAKFGPQGHGDSQWGKGSIDKSAPFDVEDLASAFIRMKSGRTVVFESSWAAHIPHSHQMDTQIFGTEAGLKMTPLTLFRNGSNGYVSEEVAPLTTSVSPNRMVHFIDVLLGLAEPLVKMEESIAVQKILDAIYESAARGHEIQLD